VSRRGGLRGIVGRHGGLFGAAGVLGVAAAGVAAGVAAERYLLHRSRHAPGIEDKYADEPFGELPYDERVGVVAPDGVELYVEIVEPDEPPAPGAPTLVFSHGFCLDMGTFHFQRRELAGDYRMVFYDQPGHGKSSRLQHGEYTLDALGAALSAVIDKTVPEGPIVLVGHSMGGMSVMALAEQAPDLFADRVVGVVLISTSAGRLNQVTFGLPEVMSRFSKPLLPVVRSAGRLTTSVVDRARRASTDLAWVLTRKYGFGSARPSPSLVSYVERMNSTTSTEVIARYVHTLHTHGRVLALATLRRVPVLVVCGDADVLTPIAHSREIVREMPDSELCVVDGGGHVALLEHSEQVNDAMRAFLQRVSR
jgi:pimeloyl-ACP methyl ester carboxylesterase